MQPNNDIGTTLSNYLDKLFNRILYKRFPEKLEQNKILSNSHCGFRKNCRTTDHMYLSFLV